MSDEHKRVLFLDIDGVMTTARAHLVFGKRGGIWNDFDPVAVTAVHRALSNGVTLVISSTWRKFPDQLFPKLDQHDMRRFLHEDWRTKELGIRGLYNRGDEIAEWLGRHPEFTSYRILDDDMDMLDHQMKKLIKTHGNEGMTTDNIRDLFYWSGVIK